MRDWIDLLSKPSLISVSVLCILGALYLLRLVLDFLKGSVFPRLYEMKLQRRRIVLPIAEKVLDSSWTQAAYFRDGDPKLIDFRDGRIFPRPELGAARGMLLKGRFLHIQGPPSSGKTVLVLNLAYEAMKAKQTVLYFNRPSLFGDDLQDFLTTPSAARLFDKKGATLVIDDVHLDVPRSSRLFALVYTNFERLRLIFVSRPLLSDDPDRDAGAHYAFGRYMPVLDVAADSIIEPMADFFSQRRFAQAMPRTVLRAFISHIRRFSSEYFEAVALKLDPSAVCEQIFKEEDLVHLKSGIQTLCHLFRDRVCIKACEVDDAFGERVNRLSFYFDTTRVTRFVRGPKIRHPLWQ